MSLVDLQSKLKDEYRSDTSDLVVEFYEPCLEQTALYQRAVGFFASTSLAVAAKGINSLIRNGGKMQLIASPRISREDADAIEQGLKQRSKVIEKAIISQLEQEFEQIVVNRLASLAWLLANELLEIRLAVPKRDPFGAVYHEKLGIFSDRDGNLIAFSGSANETESGLIDNFECIDVFPSWDERVEERARKKAENFLNLWNNKTPRLEVLNFPEAAKRSLIRFADHPSSTNFRSKTSGAQISGELMDSLALSQPGTPSIPSELRLRPYQHEAISNWMKNRGRGTLKMATGSGKTITALSAACELWNRQLLKYLIIVCPYKHLVVQWAREAKKFGINPILGYQSTRNWETQLSDGIYAVNNGTLPFVCCITTNTTFSGDVFQELIRYAPQKTFLVADEVHNLGAERLTKCLPESVPFRLGLSATPERYFDDSGSASIFAYFGEVLEPEFTLKDAIDCGALVHYDYYPVIVELTELEAEQYIELTKKIGIAIASTDSDFNDPSLTALLTKRARLVATAENKIPIVRSLVRPRLNQTHTLFYCGDGSVEDQSTGDMRRHIEVVQGALTEEGFRTETYTAETKLDERESIQRKFDDGTLPGIVAIRCLDEGVDIPSTRTAFILASSANPRQFIQRRGRILRSHESKRKAELFDLIVVPPPSDETVTEIERGLLRKELVRFVEFAELADNNGEARMVLLPLQRRFGLMDI